MMRLMTIQEAKIHGKRELVSSPTPELDTAVLLQHITGFDKTHLLLNRDFCLTAEQEVDFLSAIERRKTGFPIAYITGHKEFFGLDFYVTPDVLIPKPDTELLVELALDALEDKFRAKPDAIPTVCDMCTGSGCVGLSIAKTLSDKASEKKETKDYTDGCKCDVSEDFRECGGAEDSRSLSLTLVDISEKALDIAKKNAERLLGRDERSNVPSQTAPRSLLPAPCSLLPPHFSLLTPNSSLLTPHLSFVQSNLFENVLPTFDLIVTNPPYVPHSESVELLKDGRSEPLLALDGDVNEAGESSGSDDGLALIRRLVPQCYQHLNRNGVLIMETGEYNAEATAELFKEAGFRNIHIEYDMNEMMRDVVGVK
ncbi:HemK/PrmC family methyltransferase [Treponema sp.]|uniref:N5-glutamine methyltransferase family protein n=1 Tax=Treponema sp. TaxID=166 RepID=UPI0025E4A6E1|nr:HemK/PrmC family methyltransferase [Treponema sp.]MBR4322475.1 peptide chain release factor N(5)-glutamine methyltransferase [Treponema sp.]